MRAQLRRLGGKAGVLNRPVLDVARALCDRGAYAYDIALALYDALDGQPEAAYGCGFGMLWALRERMGEGEGPDPSETLLLQQGP